MPAPRNKRRQAIAVAAPTDNGAALDIDLAEVDLQVDEMKASLDKWLDSTVADMRRLVETAILRLPSKIKAMSMREFMTDYGGRAALVLEKEKKQHRSVTSGRQRRQLLQLE